MAAIAPDVMDCSVSSINGDSRSLLETGPAPISSPFPVSSAEPENSAKSVRVTRPLPPTPRTRRASSESACGSRPQSVLVFTDPVVEVTPAVKFSESQEDTTGFESPPSSESESQGLGADGSSRTTLTSSSISSGFEPDSAASSARTRATSASTSSCVTFAPLPEIGPRKRNSSRPLGIAARGQILRQRRMMMVQEVIAYCDNQANTVHDEQTVVQSNDGGDRTRRSDLDETEDAIVALGKMLGDATKVMWRRMSHAKLKSNGSSGSGSKSLPKRPGTNRSFTWLRRLRAASIASAGLVSSPTSGQDSDSEDSEDDIDGPWRRRRDEDPMTKTIVEGSDDGHGLEQFVLAYDAIPSCEEEEEDHMLARVDEEMRTTVEVHLVKASEGELEE